MSVSHEESPGGSHIELEEIHDNQPKSAEGSGVTLVCPSAVPDQSDAQTEDLDKRNGAESAEDRRLQGVSKTGGTQSFGDEGEKIKEDMEFGEVNLSALYRELTVEKMWHERTWFEVLKHFAITLIISVLPTLLDMGTDFIAVIEYQHEGHYIWGWTTLVIIFFPGLFFSVWISKAFNINSGCLTCCLYPVGYILFPLILVAVKIVGLLNPGQEWKRFTVKITSFEGDFESSLQMLLSLYIVFVRAQNGDSPKWWQIAQLTGSMVMITKTAIADHLLPQQPMSMKKEQKATIKLIPLFLSNSVFKVLSFATMAATITGFNVESWLNPGWNLSYIYPAAIALLHLPSLISCCRCFSIGYLTLGSPKHMVKLLVIRKGGRVTKQSMHNLLYNNVWWFVFNTILLSCCQAEVLVDLRTSVDMLPRMQEMFNVSCGVILFAAVMNIVLIYFQLWRPYKAEEEERGEDIEAGDGLDEEGSNSACICILTCFLLPPCFLIFVGFVL